MRAPSADLLLEHAAFLRRLARSLLGDEHAADDVVQETMLAALSRPPRPGNLRGWLARVARNLALRRLRREGRRARRERVAARSERLASTAEGVTRLEIQRRVVGAVLALEEPYRTVIVQRFLYERTIREVARLLDIPVETVRTRQRRALEQLRRRLDAAYGNRRASWSIALLAFARQSRGGPLSIAVGGSLAMTTKWTVAAVLLIALGLLWATLEMRGDKGAPPRAVRPASSTPLAAKPPDRGLPAPIALAPVDRDLDLHGVVVDGAGEPVAGAGLSVLRYPYRGLAPLGAWMLIQERGPHATSARDGTFRLRLRRGEEVTLRVQAKGFAPIERQWCQAGARVRIVLRKGIRLVVRAVDASGAGVAGVVLWLGKDTGARTVEAGGDFLAVEGRTDAEGRFVFQGLLPTGSRRVLVAWHPRLAVRSPGRVKVDAGEVTLHVAAGREITGFVRDAKTHAPLEGAVVGSVPWMATMKAAHTRADGWFTYRGWGPEREWQGRLFAWRRDYAIAGVEVGDKTRVDLTLVRGASVSGQLRSAAGAAVGHALVVVAGKESAGDVARIDIRDAWSGEDGGFSIQGLRPNIGHTLIVVRRGSGRLLRDLGPGSVDLGEITLPKALRVEGRVLGRGGETLPGLPVVLDQRGPTGGDWTRHERRTDDLGRFRFNDIAPGAYLLTVRNAAGGSIAHRTLQIADDVADLEISESAGKRIPVLVVDRGGRPVKGIVVMVGGARERTDATGHAALAFPRGQSTAFVSVRPSRESSYVAPVPVGYRAGEGELRIVIEDAATLTGRVFLESGEGAAFVGLFVIGEDGWRGVTGTDENGAFSVRVPANESLRLKITGEGRGGWKPIVGGLDHVVAGQRDVAVRVRSVPTNRTLRIRVVGPDGSGVEGVRCYASPTAAPPDRKLTTDREGRLLLANLPAVEVSVGIRVDLGSTAAQRWAFPDPQWKKIVPDGREIVFAFRDANFIRGRLRFPDGRHTRGGVVSAWRGKSDCVGSCVAAEDGSFALPIARDEQQPVRLEAAAVRLSDHKPLTARAEGVLPGTDGVELRLQGR